MPALIVYPTECGGLCYFVLKTLHGNLMGVIPKERNPLPDAQEATDMGHVGAFRPVPDFLHLILMGDTTLQCTLVPDDGRIGRH
ncbi:hypothetical protein PAXRUDRAFT_22381 [Paxillus rubicundulus Ve08.2h10]|uniref:Uncharacterized protein n=1 Tax=Paxillus rubicundulus Ve08.2h10 TaxID=930991 RepID=A0A0D0D5I2_9AGAM|nr:hypothetical protein PAXRUDRAFT_22381 [Paxillus rubicundulus Ve08.2h10]